ncbi:MULTISPECIES: transposase, partial [Spirulina sp. CCY15215]|uniref:transposase n=1 Tax=Spirulina sp. CCY15215 TaxID=2767591 RepID=UPI00194F411B
MYRKREQTDNQGETFEFLLEGKLCEENRWVIMSKLIPWAEFEEEYAKNFSEEMGAPAKPFRMALGALIIKEKLGISDREVVEQIKENPYLQYFIGQECYSNEAPFEASMMVHFRQRIDINLIEKVIDTLYKSIKGKLDKKPITYRKIARKEYLKVAKKRKVSRKERRKAVKKQLQYIQRNLGNIEKLIEKGVSLEILSKRQYRRFLVGNEIYRQ